MTLTAGFYTVYSPMIQGFTIYLVSEHPTTYEYRPPLHQLWMQQHPTIDWSQHLSTFFIEKSAVQLHMASPRSFGEPWFFEYPLTEEMLSQFARITLFFDTFMHFHHLSLVSRLEHTILATKTHLPLWLLQSLVGFALHQHRSHPDRLRCLVSPVLIPYLQQGGI